MSFDFDCFIIGAGSGGVRAAKLAAAQGKKVGIAEEFRYGGTCVIRGCVPKKLMLFASDFRQKFKDSNGFGWDEYPAKMDWMKFQDSKDKELARLEGLYFDGLKKAGVYTFKERAKLIGNSKVQLNSGKVISCQNIIIATGGSPLKGNFSGSNLGISSDDVFNLKALPDRIVIVGGGYIACEFATIFNGLGVKVTLIHRGNQILRGFDTEITTFVQSSMIARGIEVKLNTMVSKVKEIDANFNDAIAITLSDGECITTEKLLISIGRKPNTDRLGLEEAGVNINDSGAVAVNKYQETSKSGIYAIGDVTDRINLTPVAIRDGIAVIQTMFGPKPKSPDHQLVPSAVFTRPEIGTVGLSESDAFKLYEVKIYKTYFRPMYNILANNDEKCLIKMVVEKSSGKILGIHIAGEGAAELIQIVAIAVKKGMTKADFDQTVAVHPTLAEELVTLK